MASVPLYEAVVTRGASCATAWLSVPQNAIWCWTRAAYTMLGALEADVAADDALRRRQHLLVTPRTRVSRIAPPSRQR